MDSEMRRKIRQGRIQVADELTAACGGKLKVRHHGGHNYIVIADPIEMRQTYYLNDKQDSTVAEQLAEFCIEQAAVYAAMGKALGAEVKGGVR